MPDPGGAPGARPPKFEKNKIFWHKIVIFHTKYPKNFRTTLRNWKKLDFLVYNRDFSHGIPQKFSRLPPLGAIFLSAPPPNLKSWIRSCIGHAIIFYVKQWVQYIMVGRISTHSA
jgi:hypothetical protein